MSATTTASASSTALDANCAPDALVCAVMCVTNAANARRDSDLNANEWIWIWISTNEHEHGSTDATRSTFD